MPLSFFPSPLLFAPITLDFFPTFNPFHASLSITTHISLLLSPLTLLPPSIALPALFNFLHFHSGLLYLSLPPANLVNLVQSYHLYPPLLFPCLTKSHLPFPSISLFLLSREMIWLLFFVIIYSNLLILHFPFSLSFISPPSHLILLLYHLHSFISSPLYLCTISPPPPTISSNK